jgi:hypothetical protein
MINFQRDTFQDMTTEQKITFVNDLVVKNTKLTEEEIEYLVPNNRGAYFYNRVRTSDWLENYEFNAMSDREKEIYIWNKRFLQKADLARLPEKLQKEYISKTITSGVQLTPEEFNLLANDKLRSYYAKEKIKYSIDTTFTSEELLYLDADDQMQYLNTLSRLGFAPNPDEIPALKPEARRYYESHKSLNEIRSIIKQEIRKIL